MVLSRDQPGEDSDLFVAPLVQPRISDIRPDHGSCRCDRSADRIVGGIQDTAAGFRSLDHRAHRYLRNHSLPVKTQVWILHLSRGEVSCENAFTGSSAAWQLSTPDRIA